MSYVDMAISKGAYVQKSLDSDNNGVNEFNRVINSKSGVIEFEDFDFDQNGATDYRRGYQYTAQGKQMYEEFFANSTENNAKVYRDEPSLFEKALRFFGVETETTKSDLDIASIREEADILTEQFREQNTVPIEELNSVKEALNKQLEDLKPFLP